jgi:hypothetical protein
MNRSKPVREAAIYVIEESRQACSKVTEWIECLNDILFPSLSVLRCGRQKTHVGAQVLSPIVNVLFRVTSIRVPLNPPSDVLGKPLAEFGKILRNEKSIVPDIMPFNIIERIARVSLFGEQALLRS